MNLVIVESPTKAKTIASFLGHGWRVEACRGHVRDLPVTSLGIDLTADFRPTYEVLPGKGALVRRLLKAMTAAETIYLATDPDREGEAIAWHLLALANLPRSKPIYRAAFHAITKEAVQAAVATPRALDVPLVEAQQARRIVDRLVGYLTSPLAAKALSGPASAGRVQSVCLRLVVEREREIERFTPDTFWTLTLTLAAERTEFQATLSRVKEVEGRTKTREPLDRLTMLLKNAQIWVHKAGRSLKRRSPLPPFTTSSLQQAAAKALELSPDRTMALAQILYEQGWITYMRTDGVSVAPDAQETARDYITHAYGPDYLPPEPPIYTVKTAHAQEAHEAIRPTDLQRLPQAVSGEGAALYALIWRRFLASQMAPAQDSVTVALIAAGQTREQPFPLEFRAQGRTQVFDGFRKVYEEPSDEGDPTSEPTTPLPLLRDQQALTLVAPQVEDCQTRAPARYTEAALVQALEQRGIGRPSTYASMVKTVKDRGYVTLQHKRLVPTERGQRLCAVLTTHFADVLAEEYTARLETQLDQIAQGQRTRLEVLQAFWATFEPQLRQASSLLLATEPSKPLMLHPAED